MTVDDPDNLDLQTQDVFVPPPGADIPLATPAGSVSPATTIHEPIPPLREIRARLINVGDEGKTESAESTESGDAGNDAEKSAVLLEDPEGYATQPAVLSTWAYMLALLFDGRRTAVEVADAFHEKYAKVIRPEQALNLQDELENAMLLNSSTFEESLQQRLNHYLAMPSWPAVHAGSAYPADVQAFSETAASFFTAPDGPGKVDEGAFSETDSIRAVVLPHIDLRVGGATYAHAYKDLMVASQAELIFVLGVAHQHMGEHLYSVSQKSYETPLGTLANARDISLRLHQASGADDVAAELAHRGEHSIEFQAALIQAYLTTRCKRTVDIVPILCGPIDGFLSRDVTPFKDAEFERFTDALRHELETCGRKWCVMCSVDLSHVGPEFGHSSLIDVRLLKPLERMDRKLLKLLEKLDSEGFYGEIARTQNSRHVDAVLSVLTMLSACRWMLKPGRLLHYDQMLKAQSHSAVSYAAMSFEEAGKVV